MNNLDQRPENLAQTHHAPILKAVLAALENHNPFAWRKTGSRLLLDVDSIAQTVLARTWRESDLLTTAPQGSARTSTLHMLHEERDEVRHLLHKIQDKLAQHLEQLAVSQSSAVQDLARHYKGALEQIPPFGDLAKEIPNELKRPFSAKRKRLTFTKPAESALPSSGNAPLPSTVRSPLMRWHKLTLTIQTPHEVIERLAEAARLRLEQIPSPSDHQELGERIKEQVASPHSELARLVRIIATETVMNLLTLLLSDEGQSS